MATLGYTGTGGQHEASPGDTYTFQRLAAPTEMIISDIAVLVDGSSGDGVMGVICMAEGSRIGAVLGATEEISANVSGQWVGGALTEPVTLASGEVFYLGIAVNGTVNLHYGSQSGWSAEYGCSGQFSSAPEGNLSGSTSSSRMYSLYATYAVPAASGMSLNTRFW
jgi:hypothetical protein